MVLVPSIINVYGKHQVDFVLAFPQARIKFDMYMEIPEEIKTKYGNRKTHVLKLLKQLYEKRQGCRVWNQHLPKVLQEIGFQQSRVDDCMFYWRKVIFTVYVDEGIFDSL